jgi:hypothetical protein
MAVKGSYCVQREAIVSKENDERRGDLADIKARFALCERAE